MPQEVSHWHLGVEAIRKSPPLFSKMKESPKYEMAFLLGAITPDSSYFNGAFYSNAELIAEYIHGRNGEDTFSLVRGLFALASKSNSKDAERSTVLKFFSLGILSHIIIDSEVHPLVFFLSGDYYDPKNSQRSKARAAHRNLESILEHHIKKNSGTLYSSLTIFKILKGLFPLAPFLSESICTVLRKSFKKSKESKIISIKNDSFLDAWQYHAILNILFTSKSSGSFIRKCPLFPKGIRALCILTSDEQLNVIQKHFTLKGKDQTLLSVCEKAKLRLEEYFFALENSILGLEDDYSILDTWGPSLNSGIPKKGLPDKDYLYVPEIHRL